MLVVKAEERTFRSEGKGIKLLGSESASYWILYPSGLPRHGRARPVGHTGIHRSHIKTARTKDYLQSAALNVAQ